MSTSRDGDKKSMQERERIILSGMFRRYDADSSGRIDSLEFKDMCSVLGLDEHDFATFDTDADGSIAPKELEAYMDERYLHHQQHWLGFMEMGQQHAAIQSREALSGAVSERLAAAFSGPVCGEGGLCSGHGSCNLQTGQCVCDAPFTGEICDVEHCPGFREVGVDCSAHGICQAGACQCAPGWGLLAGKSGPNSCEDRVCPLDCGDHGHCVDGTCQCRQGWTGVNCRDPQCPGGCSGHGSCTLPSAHSPGECMCDYGWAGAACQRIALYEQLRKCPEDCSGNGLCMDGMCQCNVGFSGPACAERMCGHTSAGPDCDLLRCPADCHGQGLCLDGQCACWEAFTGRECSVPEQCNEPCREDCESDMESSERCMFCVGQCTTMRGHAVLGTHNPLEDLMATLLQVRRPSSFRLHALPIGANIYPKSLRGFDELAMQRDQ